MSNLRATILENISSCAEISKERFSLIRSSFGIVGYKNPRNTKKKIDSTTLQNRENDTYKQKPSEETQSFTEHNPQRSIST